MIFSIATVADFDQFLNTFSTRGAEKRKEHGCKGSRVFRDPDDPSRVVVAFDWETEDYERFIADPEVPSIFQELGLRGPPVNVKAEPVGEYDS
jgi:quinol monooxygenase YgiN